jgi:hypothetical protein
MTVKYTRGVRLGQPTFARPADWTREIAACLGVAAIIVMMWVAL